LSQSEAGKTHRTWNSGPSEIKQRLWHWPLYR